MSYQRAYNNILYKKCITLLGIFVLVFIDYWSLLSHYGFSCFKKNSKKILPHNTLLPKLKSMFIHSGPSPFPSHTHTYRKIFSQDSLSVHCTVNVIHSQNTLYGLQARADTVCLKHCFISYTPHDSSVNNTYNGGGKPTSFLCQPDVICVSLIGEESPADTQVYRQCIT